MEDPGIPPAAQRPLRRAKGFRPTGIGPAGRNCTRSPHAATHGVAHPRRLGSPDPTPGLRQLSEPGAEDREKGRRGTPELDRGAQGSDVRARGPLSSRGPELKTLGLGITDGAGQKESPGAPRSAAVLFLKCFLISAVRTPLCSPATLLLPRCAFVLNGRCRSGHHGVTSS